MKVGIDQLEHFGKATEDKEEKDTPPNVFGGGTPEKPLKMCPQ